MGEEHPADDKDNDRPARTPAGSEAEASPAVLADADPEPEGEAAQAYHQRARLAEDRLAEVLSAYRKLKTDNEGHRDRLTRNLDRRYEQRRERFLLKFIDILDNLDRALEAAQISYAGAPLLEGMILVRTQLLQTLRDEGLERIPVLGLAFDPHVSESVGTADVADPDQDHLVVKEFMRGYRLNGKLARVSTVVIGTYTPGPDAALSSPAALDQAVLPAFSAPVPPTADEPAPAPALPSVAGAGEEGGLGLLDEGFEREPAGLDAETDTPAYVLDIGDADAALADVRDLTAEAAAEKPRPEDDEAPRPAATHPEPERLVSPEVGRLQEAAPAEPTGPGELSLEEIVARAEAQEVLFPHTHQPAREAGDEPDRD